jgi:mono/diheme cytochrome c family protein
METSSVHLIQAAYLPVGLLASAAVRSLLVKPICWRYHGCQFTTESGGAMKKFAIGILAALCLSSGAFAQGTGADVTSGKGLWEGANTNCRNCHGRLGEGGFGPPLAGRNLSTGEFQQAVRKPWGLMPAFTQEQVSDAELANFAAYFAGLAKVAEPGPWRFPVPQDGRRGQRVAISLGCAQCHGATFDIARGIFGGTALGFAQFKDLVYDHTVAMPKLGIAEGNTPGQRLHMGNYDRLRISDQQLKEIYDWTKNDLGFRPFMEARLTAKEPAGATYVLKIENSGFKQKGPAAQDVIVNIVLPAGATVIRATGDGYKGVHADPAAKVDVAEWRLAKIAPTDEQTFEVTLSAPVDKAAGLKGTLSWAKPAPKTGAKLDVMNFALRAPG